MVSSYLLRPQLQVGMSFVKSQPISLLSTMGWVSWESIQRCFSWPIITPQCFLYHYTVLDLHTLCTNINNVFKNIYVLKSTPSIHSLLKEKLNNLNLLGAKINNIWHTLEFRDRPNSNKNLWHSSALLEHYVNDIFEPFQIRNLKNVKSLSF